MKSKVPDYGLENLLEYDGRVHHLGDGYWIKFKIERTELTDRRPHGLSYSFSLHAPDGTRLLGFDNAHPVDHMGSNLKKGPIEHDHWHRTEEDPGRPYEFKDAITLLDDFFEEVERILKERNIGMDVVSVEEKSE